jgi:hypothetical protein
MAGFESSSIFNGARSPLTSSPDTARSFGEEQDLECPICLEDLEDIAKTCVCACDRCTNGTFHTKCILEWCFNLRGSGKETTCPNCNGPINP